MTPWATRPREAANLINPAFCGLLLREFVTQFEKEAHARPEFVLLFLALPLTLHKETRAQLPDTTATRLHVWLERVPQARIGFASRARALAPFVREAFSFACASNWLELHQPHHVSSPRRRMRSKSWMNFDENASCIEASGFLGKWFAQAGSTTTLFSLWGVQP